MSREQLALRLISSECFVDNKKLVTGNLGPEDWEKIMVATESLNRSHILIDDDSTVSVADILAKCRRVDNLGLVIIDYLQLMQSAGGRQYSGENRQQVVSDISRALKIMAKELDVPVLCLSQLSRANESRSDKRPMLSDLRESGAIEQDADIVMFLYREATTTRRPPTPIWPSASSPKTATERPGRWSSSGCPSLPPSATWSGSTRSTDRIFRGIMTDPMVQLIREYRLIPPGSAVLCAVSGGADSIYLLHRLWRLRRELNFTLAAAHFDHRLRGAESAQDMEFVRVVCLPVLRPGADAPSGRNRGDAAPRWSCSPAPATWRPGPRRPAGVWRRPQ